MRIFIIFILLGISNAFAGECRIDNSQGFEFFEAFNSYMQEGSQELQALHEKAKSEEKFLLVMMSATWCAPCKMMKETLLPQERFKSMVEEQDLVFGMGDFSNQHDLDQLRLNYISNFGSSVPRMLLIKSSSLEKLERGEILEESDFRVIQARSFHDGEGATRDDGSPIIPIDEEIKRAKEQLIGVS